MTLLEELVRAEALSYLLEASRIAGLVVVAPLSWQSAPARVRAGLVLALAAVAHGLGAGAMPTDPLAIAFGVLSELGIGATMGFVVRVAISVAEIAAEVISPMMGLAAAHLFDPHAGSGTVLSSLLRHIAVLLALVAGVHRVVLGALVESFRVLPLGSGASFVTSVPLAVRLGADALAAGLRIAIPVVAILFMTQVALAFVSRAAPALQIFSLGFTVTLGVGWAVLILTAPDLSHRLIAELSHVGGDLERVVLALAARPP